MSTYTSYNSYLGSKSCCNTICQEKCNNSSGSTGITGPAGPQGIQGEPGANTIFNIFYLRWNKLVSITDNLI
jgi:hypothetical protein